MTRTEIRRRALRAAAAVTFGVAMMGCAADVTEGAAPDDEDAQATAGGDGGQDVAPPTHHHHPGTSTATGVVATGGGGAGGGAAQPECLAVSDGGQDWDAYTKCCTDNNWDWNKGCEAWGPPMPPSMDWNLEVVS